MIDSKQFISAIKQIAEEKGIPEEQIIETIELAIAAAYKRDYGEKGQIVKAKMDRETEKFTMTQVKYVVEGVDEEGNIIGEVPGISFDDKERREREAAAEAAGTEQSEEIKIQFNPERYLTLEEAKKLDKKLKVGDELIIPLEGKDEFGRIAAQTAKQVIIQRLREIERGVILQEFKNREGEAVSGIVQRREGPLVFIDLGKTNGLLPASEQLLQDGYRIGQRLKFLIYKVDDTSKGPVVLLSRTHPGLVTKLFEFEVPEIEAGTVVVRGIAREAGSRSKIAVSSDQQGIDPIGSLVGQKGVRVQTVINELSGEKIDIIKWDDDPAKLVANSLSPAKILEVKIINESHKHALAEVADDQFSLAIGKKGQNVRLAAKLTGWKIDVRSPQSTVSAEQAENGEVETSKAVDPKIAPDSVESESIEQAIDDDKAEEVFSEAEQAAGQTEATTEVDQAAEDIADAEAEASVEITQK